MTANSPHALVWALTLGALATHGANAQTLTIGGSCPGAMTVELTGAAPSSQVAMVTGDAGGDEIVPAGPCSGTRLDLGGDITHRGSLSTDANGRVSITPTIPPTVCGASLQAVQLSDCTISNTARFAFAEPQELGLSCEPTSNALRFVCTVTVDPPQPVEILYSRTDGLGVERANGSEEIAATHTIPALFLAPVNEYTVTAVATEHPLGPTATAGFMTGFPPLDADSWLTMNGQSTMGLVGAETPCDGDALAVVYDTDTGDLVWYEDIDPSGSLGVLDMIRYTDEMTVLGETGGTVVEVDLMGNVLTRFDTFYPGCCNLHHDIFKWGGNYYGFYQDTRGGLTLDAVVVLDADGNELWEWDPREYIDVPPGAFGDWLHTNSVFVEDDGSFTLSWLTRDSVAKVDGDPTSPTFGEILWIMDGNPPGQLPSDIEIDWSAVPGADFFSDQHNFSRRHDGRYMLLDNDHGRGIVFTIDEENGTATADAVYETVESSCGAQGTATDTEAGNALVACLNEDLREYDGETGEGIWQGHVNCANGGGGFFGTGSARWYSLDAWHREFSPSP